MLGLILSIVTLIPQFNSKGQLDIQHLNNAVQLASIQPADLVIPAGIYKLPADQQIKLRDNCKLIANGVKFVYESGEYYELNIIEAHWINNSGIEGLEIDFSETKPEKITNRAIIQLEHSENITIKNVTIKKILGSGIEISNSKFCKVENCTIEGAHIYGYKQGGTQGYGINLVGNMSSFNLIRNNYINDNRHGIVIQYGANNNLIDSNRLYNSKALNFWWVFKLYDNNTFNITLHGNAPHNNVIKGNTCYRITIDNVKKQGNGPNNEIIGNFVERIEVQSVAPYYDYNQGQRIENNKVKFLLIEAKNCINENNIK